MAQASRRVVIEPTELVVIGVDPHKRSHTAAVVIGRHERADARWQSWRHPCCGNQSLAGYQEARSRSSRTARDVLTAACASGEQLPVGNASMSAPAPTRSSYAGRRPPSRQRSLEATDLRGGNA